ncbi:DUF3545 family protein [Oceanimonas baumannii]|uniref:DUF3545 domain-containing protein n=1 Tax=Oceanimonas baumannii TaxID=129578 RepID=A0A235CL43_9GAMM|nr:DUF3545 family protein [Oceanimonas baumannii]MCC4265100.1 DUF3545 family protein [Oceanimonas baumannii]OYD25084.1 DUF3545 domain-containing protein [Oceanimonas baumannii]TDW59865.1 uncharacterized protein DUF3545 [Oceanimonas baumannii]
MERSCFDQSFVVEKAPRASREPAKKRKWREIEALMDRKRLRDELQELDCTFEPEEELTL